MTRIFTQSSLALITLIMPITLIVGMLSFPSTCQCGAELPHDHSLFMLAGHSHAPGAHDHSHAHDHADDSSKLQRNVSVTYDGPTIQIPAANASAQTEGAVLAYQSLSVNSESLLVASTEQPPRIGQTQTPAVPPPRL